MIWTPYRRKIRPLIITTLSEECLGHELSAMRAEVTSSRQWPTVGLVIYIPFYVIAPCTVYKLGWHNGNTSVSGNKDAAVLDASGTRLVSTGLTAGSSASTLQMVDVADTALSVGMHYMAVGNSDTTGRLYANDVGVAAFNYLFGCFEDTSLSGGGSIPSSVSLTTVSSVAWVPHVIVAARATI